MLISGLAMHMVSKGFIKGIQIDPNSKEEFCKPCTKAKAARKLFLKESHARDTP